MIDVEKLNKEIQALGLGKIGFIAEVLQGSSDWDWNCYADPEVDGKVFGFDAKTCSFKADTYKYWDSYKIVKSNTLEGMYDIIFIGRGSIYTVA